MVPLLSPVTPRLSTFLFPCSRIEANRLLVQCGLHWGDGIVCPRSLGLLSAILIALGGWDVVGVSQIEFTKLYGNTLFGFSALIDLLGINLLSVSPRWHRGVVGCLCVCVPGRVIPDWRLC